MTELTIRNKDILSKLDYIKSGVLKTKLIENPEKFFNNERNSIERGRILTYTPDDAIFNPEKYLKSDYLVKHMNDPDHKGFPVEYYSLPLDRLKSIDSNLEKIDDYARHEFIADLGANSSAVFLYYPPGGFVGWHTNQNNSGYQFIFSWSEKGDGYFQYYDKQKEEIVRLPDKSGWQARYYHFGKDEPDHCWHSAYTNVPRITVCVLFRWHDKPHMKKQILAMKDQLIEEIELED